MNLKYYMLLYVELEKNYFFSSLLYNKKNSENKDSTIDSEFNKKIEEIFIKTINLKNRVPENEIKIDIFIGYNLPSKNLLEEIFYFLTNNIIEKYRQTENQFKNNYYEESEELKEGKQQYENAIEIINKYTYDNLSKNKIIMEVESKLEKGEKNKFYNLLFDDYLLFFIYRSFKEEKFTRGDICIFDIVKKVLIKSFINEFKILYVTIC